jgi:hypothetical protein
MDTPAITSVPRGKLDSIGDRFVASPELFRQQFQIANKECAGARAVQAKKRILENATCKNEFRKELPHRGNRSDDKDGTKQRAQRHKVKNPKR